jgi:SulP family sulfate permease
MNSLRQDWLSNVRNDLLAGLVVALALIPEAIAFSIIAGVDPRSASMPRSASPL